MAAIALSIIIPTHGRSSSALQTLRTVVNQETLAPYEILIAASDWDESLRQAAEAIGVQNSISVRCLHLSQPGLHHGRHAGARQAQSDCLAFLDDDVKVAPGWIDAVVSAFQDDTTSLVGGKCLPLYEMAPPEWLDAFWSPTDRGRMCIYLSLVDLGNVAREVDPHLVWGLNFAIRRPTLLAVGGFHPDSLPWEQRRFRGDGETHVSREILRRGWKAVYRPDALVYHRVPASRLTIEYFEKRAHLQGISDSYTAFRARGVVDERWRARRAVRRLLSPAIQVGKAVHARARRLWRTSGSHWEKRRRVHDAYLSGYAYHQEQLLGDAHLVAWVLRSDYWDDAGCYRPGKS